MSYKKKSPLHNANYFSGGATVPAVKLNTKMVSVPNMSTQGQSVSGGKPTTNPKKLTNKKKGFYPDLQEKAENAKNSKQKQRIENKIQRKSIRHDAAADRNQMKDNVTRASQKERKNVRSEKVRKKQVERAKEKGYKTKKDLAALGIDKEIKESPFQKKGNPTDPPPSDSTYTSEPVQIGKYSITVSGKDKPETGYTTSDGKPNWVTPPITNTKASKDEIMRENFLTSVTKDSPANYLNPNTMGVTGDSGQQEQGDMGTDLGNNRAGRPVNSNILMNDPTNYQDPSKISATQQAASNLYSNLASEGQPTQNDQMQTSPFNKKDWIQDVNKDIEKRGTKGVCTGDKFGSESCPPGSKRYNLAKTFKKMNKK